jgi:hypothetical protein
MYIYACVYIYIYACINVYICVCVWAGDNPLTVQDEDEVQLIKCRSVAGSFLLQFRENITLPIMWNTSAHLMKHRLQQLYTISTVDVVIIATNASHNESTVCNEFGDNEVYVTFLSEHGDLPLLKLHSTDSTFATSLGYNSSDSGSGSASYVDIFEVQRGTKEERECSAMGICDSSVGVCACVDGYRSSNGTIGFPGSRYSHSLTHSLTVTHSLTHSLIL